MCIRDRDDRALAEETAEVLLHVLETTLRALHPMMPFITEDIWQRVPRAGDAAATESIMLARYPEAGRDGLRDEASETELTVVQDGVPEAIPLEMCYLGWQQSLAQLAKLVEPDIPA